MNWRGRPLTSHEVIVQSIAATTTRTGLRVHAELDPGSYPAGKKVSDAEMDALPLGRHAWHGEWNYTLHPAPPAPPPPGPGTSARAHPALTGLDPAQWDQLITAVHSQAGEPPPGPQPLSLADQALITWLRLRFRTPPAALAGLYGVHASTIRTASDLIWPCLVHAGYHTPPPGPRLRTLPELTAYARAHGLEITPRSPIITLSDGQHPKPAC